VVVVGCISFYACVNIVGVVKVVHDFIQDLVKLAIIGVC